MRTTYVVPEPAVTRLKASSRSLSLSISFGGNLLSNSSWKTVLSAAFPVREFLSSCRMASTCLDRSFITLDGDGGPRIRLDSSPCENRGYLPWQEPRSC